MAKQARLVNIPRSEEDEFYRYKMPELLVKNEGKGNGVKTVITNINDVAKALKRPAPYLHKVFGYAHNTPTTIDGDGRAVINGTFNKETLAKDLDAFIDRYVLCQHCQNPETTMIIKGNSGELVCKACGGITTLRLADKLGNFILKNPPEKDKSEKEHKAMEGEREKIEVGNNMPTPALQKDKEVVISTEISDEAVARRRRAALGGNKNALLGSREMTKEETAEEVERLLGYHREGEPVSIDGVVYTDHAIGVELSKLHQLAQCDTTDIVALLAMSLPLGESQPLPKQLCAYYEVLLPLLQDKAEEQMAFLVTLSRRCRKVKAFRESFGNALFGIYQKDCLDDCVILGWFDKSNKKKKITPEEKELLSMTEKFIDWLNEAEEEDEDEEDEEDE